MKAPAMVYLRPYLWVETDGKPRRLLAHKHCGRLAMSELKGFMRNLDGVAELAVMDAPNGTVLCYL